MQYHRDCKNHGTSCLIYYGPQNTYFCINNTPVGTTCSEGSNHKRKRYSIEGVIIVGAISIMEGHGKGNTHATLAPHRTLRGIRLRVLQTVLNVGYSATIRAEALKSSPHVMANHARKKHIRLKHHSCIAARDSLVGEKWDFQAGRYERWRGCTSN